MVAIPPLRASPRLSWLVESGVARATVLAVVAAAAATFAWYAATVGTQSELLYLVVVIGVIVGVAAHVGAGRRRAAATWMAVAVTAVAACVGFYLVGRSSLIRRGYIRLPDNDPAIPLRPTYTVVRDVLRISLHDNVAAYLYTLVALGAAAWISSVGFEVFKQRPTR